MNKIMFLLIAVVILIVVISFLLKSLPGGKEDSKVVEQTGFADPVITPVEHATFVLDWAGNTIYNDPVGDPAQFSTFAKPNIILLSDIHGDHLSVETLEAIIGPDTRIIAPQAVFEMLSSKLQPITTVLNNNQSLEIAGISLKAMPMYNLPAEDLDHYHVKGRGNGYLLTHQDQKIYIAGDTEGIPEMLSLTRVTVAFVPMNLPYTMSVEAAAAAVLEFKPNTVYPYHYRGTDGLSDVKEFERIIIENDPTIEVMLLDWYPDQADETIAE